MREQLPFVFDAETAGSSRRAPSELDAKAYGAFYTDAQIADFLAAWAIRLPGETVADPSFGGGIFLRAAAKRIAALGGSAMRQIYGVELDEVVHGSIAHKLREEFSIPASHLLQGDFFRDSSRPAEAFSTVIGNPPFIRYQKFNGANRAVALEVAARLGVSLSAMSSAWAPFLVASVSRVKEGGRLGMVVPMELCHAAYARPVLEFLGGTFEKVTFLSFDQPLFPTLNESTMLLLAENRGTHAARFLHRDFPHPGLLSSLLTEPHAALPGTQELDRAHLLSRGGRLIEYLLPRGARELYAELKRSDRTIRLGALAKVGIGYVSGANAFFHPDAQAIAQWKIPAALLKPVVRRSSALRGLRLTHDDWKNRLPTGEAAYLLHLAAAQALPSGVAAYVHAGESAGLHSRYKCRKRSPWYSVPHVYRADAFLSYMSTRSPRLVSNEAQVFAPNTLHVVRFHQGMGSLAENVAAGWQTSLSRLSCELQGHALGGGLLKLEPTEAEETLLPRFSTARPAVFREIDELLRSGKDKLARELADRAILQGELNLSPRDCRLLAAGVECLQQRRL